MSERREKEATAEIAEKARETAERREREETVETTKEDLEVTTLETLKTRIETKAQRSLSKEERQTTESLRRDSHLDPKTEIMQTEKKSQRETSQDPQDTSNHRIIIRHTPTTVRTTKPARS